MSLLVLGGGMKQESYMRNATSFGTLEVLLKTKLQEFMYPVIRDHII